MNPYAKFNYNQDLGTCPCDMTQNECDINCCCDPDCTDFKSSPILSQCVTPIYNPLVPLCSKLLVTVNNLGAMGAVTNRGGDGSLCVVLNNSPVTGFFFPVYYHCIRELFLYYI